MMGKQAAASEEGDKTLKLDSRMLELEEMIELDEMIEDRQGKILMLDSEVDCKILMMVKTEEGKILKLKKELDAAMEVALAAVSHHIAPTLKPAEPEPAGKKKKVVKTLVPLGLIPYIKAMPSPTSHFNLPESYYESKEQLYKSGTFKLMNMKLRDYHQALVDQYDKFGFAVDETELSDDKGEEDRQRSKARSSL